MPVYNPAGKYLVKLNVNGVARKVSYMATNTTLTNCLWADVDQYSLKTRGGVQAPCHSVSYPLWRKDVVDVSGAILWLFFAE